MVFTFCFLFLSLLFLSFVSFFLFFFFLNKVYLVLVKGAELAALEMGAFSGLPPLGTNPVLGQLADPCTPLPSPIAASSCTS